MWNTIKYGIVSCICSDTIFTRQVVQGALEIVHTYLESNNNPSCSTHILVGASWNFCNFIDAMRINRTYFYRLTDIPYKLFEKSRRVAGIRLGQEFFRIVARKMQLRSFCRCNLVTITTSCGFFSIPNVAPAPLIAAASRQTF